MSINYYRHHTRLTPEQERDIRKAFFYDGTTPERICAKFAIGQQRLRKIVGGPLKRKETAIERSYS